MSVLRLTCFVDCTNGGFVVGTLSREAWRLRAVGQQDSIYWKIQFLEAVADQGYAVPFSVIPITGTSLKVAIGYLAATPLCEQDLWTYDAPTNTAQGVLALDTEAMRAAFTPGVNVISPYLEFQFTDPDGTVTPIHQQIDIFRELILSGSPLPAPPGDSFYTQADARALFVKRIGQAGEGRFMTSPDGTKTVFEYLGNDGSLHYDPVSPPVT